jgi:hypothetical protein
MNFTHNNHLTYSIGDRLYGRRESCEEKYKVNVGKIDQDHYKKSNWFEEQKRTADIVYKDYKKDFVIMFSGGTDSEIVVRTFLKIGIIPRCIFIKFKNDYNIEDYIIALEICKSLGITLEVIEFDVIDFYRSGNAAEFSKNIQCRQIAYLTIYNAIKNLGIPAIMGGEMLLRRQVSQSEDSYWYYTFRENEDASAMRFSLEYNIPLVNEWFSYTPEMIAYYLEHPGVQALISTKYNYKLSSVSSKNKILKDLFPEIVDKKKTHGYENLGAFNIETYFELYKTHVPRLENSLDGVKLVDLVKMLGMEDNENIKVRFESQ